MYFEVIFIAKEINFAEAESLVLEHGGNLSKTERGWVISSTYHYNGCPADVDSLEYLGDGVYQRRAPGGTEAAGSADGFNYILFVEENIEPVVVRGKYGHFYGPTAFDDYRQAEYDDFEKVMSSAYDALVWVGAVYLRHGDFTSHSFVREAWAMTHDYNHEMPASEVVMAMVTSSQLVANVYGSAMGRLYRMSVGRRLTRRQFDSLVAFMRELPQTRQPLTLR